MLTTNKLLCVLVAAILASGFGAPAGAPAGTAERVVFSHSTFEDFSGGTLGNAGQNLFVSRDGAIRWINWFDLNADGYPDIVINNDHGYDENVDAMIYYNRGGRGLRSLLPPMADDTTGFQRLRWQQESLKTIDFLPSLGGGKLLVADLNGNGYLDIVFTNFIHGWAKDRFPVYIYWGGPAGYSVRNRSELPSMWARGVAAADLSGNGRLDLVLANYGMEYHASETFHGDQYESWIYWQDDRGFSEDNRSTLPTEYAVDVQVADLNGDGRLQIIVLNTGPRPAARIFSRAAEGYDVKAFVDIPVLNPALVHGPTNQILVSDLNGNGRLDLFVSSAGSKSEIFWNGPKGLDPQNRSELETLNATAAAAADLSGDGWPDLVIANHHGQLADGPDFEVPSYIYWGSEEGFSSQRRTELPTLGAAGVAIGPVTDSGRKDIIFANSQNNATHDVPSYIYKGTERGYHPAARQDLHAFGPVDVRLADLSRDGRLDVVLMNRNSGTDAEAGVMPSHVYWGNEVGMYCEAAASRLPINSGYSSSAGDLNNSGHADLAFSTGHRKAMSLTVMYGRDGDYPAGRMAVHPMPFRGMTTSMADFNRDGYLDVLVAGLGRGGKSLAILHGQPDGLSEPRFFDVAMGVISSAVGDLSGDGCLEIVLGGRGELRVIPLGPDGTPDPQRGYWLRVDRQTQRMALADLSGNGYLDMVASHYRDNTTKRLTVPSAIYWNRNGRLRAEDRTELQTYGGHWASVADVFGTGQLDVIFSNYHGEHRRDLDLFIYRPDSSGRYGLRKDTVPALSSSAHLVMDFTGNGHNDLLVVNHTGPTEYIGLSAKSGTHAYGSYLYEGSADGFQPRRRTILPSFGPHKIINAEPGDIARRRPYETYTSAPVPVPDAGNYTIEVVGRYNFRTDVEVAFRASESGEWTAARPIAAEDNRKRFAVQLDRKTPAFQYKLRLHTGGSGTGPLIESVRMVRDR